MAAKRNIKSVDFDGNTFEYDADAITSYSVLKAISRVETDPLGYFNAIGLIFMGRDEEYADILGGSAGKIGELYAACAKDNVEAKN